MSFARTDEGFWQKRLTLTMPLTLGVIIVGPTFLLNYLASASPEIRQWLNTPWQILVDLGFSALWQMGGELLFRWTGTVPNDLYYDLMVGRFEWFGRALYGVALALLAFLINLDFFGGPKTRPKPFGSARFAQKPETRKFQKNTGRGLIVGSRDGTLRPRKSYYYDGNRHLLSLAPTRSGKGTCLIIPNLLTADRSVLVTDPKGENARITARQRETFGPVHVLDPFGVSGLATSAYNPLADLDADDPNFADDAASLASALIIIKPGAREPHFEEGARSLMRGLIMFAAAEEPVERRTLVTVREYLTWPPDKFNGLLALMAETPTAGGAIRRAANSFLGKREAEARSIVSTAQEQTTFLESPGLGKSLARSDVAFSTLKQETMTIYLVLPESRFESHGRWLRLLVARACQDIERTPRPKPGRRDRKKGQAGAPPVLFLLDEFAAIGDMPAIKTAIGLMAGYDLQIWAFLQNWGQLEELYDKGAHTFAANSGVFHAFNINDTLTARYVSDLSGDATYTAPPSSLSLYETPPRPSARKLITPEEAMHRLSDADLFLKYAGTPPIIARKAYYYEDKAMMRKAEA